MIKRTSREILRLKEARRAVILVHNYQLPEIQDIGDFCGDSLELSRKAADTDAEVIIFCGVDFMAQTAKILSPSKKVILPAAGATCPMADMIRACDLREFRQAHPRAGVVTYVNSTADVKALSDICCTSSNAVRIVNSMRAAEIIFVPDRNLAHYVSLHTEKKIIPWPGFCPVHEKLTPEAVLAVKDRYPAAVFMAHPECRPSVLKLADYTVSTGQMFEVAAKETRRSFIVGTEAGMLYPLGKRLPDREFIPAGEEMICPNMKKTSLGDVLNALETLSPEIDVSSSEALPARAALERMLSVS